MLQLQHEFDEIQLLKILAELQEAADVKFHDGDIVAGPADAQRVAGERHVVAGAVPHQRAVRRSDGDGALDEGGGTEANHVARGAVPKRREAIPALPLVNTEREGVGVEQAVAVEIQVLEGVGSTGAAIDQEVAAAREGAIRQNLEGVVVGKVEAVR